MNSLNLDNPTSEIASFVGNKDLLIVGDGSVVIEKSLNKGNDFYPMTDSCGDIIVLESEQGIIYNAKIENTNGNVRYRIRLESGSANYEVV